MLTTQRSTFPFARKDIGANLLHISQDLQRVVEWRCANHLLINSDKTKLMLFRTRQILSKLPGVTIPFLGKNLTPVTYCKDLGVTLDSSLTFNDHVACLTLSLLGKLCHISKVGHLFSKEVLLVILNSLIFC